MTIDQAIAMADALRPNLLGDGEKARWVIELEDRLERELGREARSLRWPEDGGVTLAAQGGYEDVYVLWLCARIDLALREYDNWNNMASILNALIDDYKKQCLRDEAPAPKQARGVWRRRV